MAPALIRLAQARDLPVLVRMRYAFRAELGSVNETKRAFARRSAAWMRKRLCRNASPWRCWVAEHRKRLVGHVCVQLFEKIPNPVDEPELHAYLTNCYVIPEMRNQGIGQQLLCKALDWCRVRGVNAVILWASPQSRPLYRRSGFALSSDIFELLVGTRKPRRVRRSKRRPQKVRSNVRY